MASSSTIFSSDTKRTLVASLVIVGVIVGAYIVWRPTPAETPSTTKNSSQIAAVTPQSYTMISGRVSAVNLEKKTLAVDFLLINQTGQQSTKRYIVTIDDQTALQSVNQSVTPVTTTDIGLADITINDAVAVLAGKEIAHVDAFTATSLIRTK